MIIHFKKLVPGLNSPSYSRQGDAAIDLVAVSKNETEEYIEYGTGIAVEIPEGYAGFLLPRSSVSKTSLVLSNSVGLIDSNYRGEIKARFKRLAGESHYQIGERICQLMVLSVPTMTMIEVNELSDTVRGDKGFGSSGK